MRSVVISSLSFLAGAIVAGAPAPAHAQDWNDPVRCASQDGHYARCVMPWRDARLVRQESKAACIRDEGWGVDRGILWVDRGCRADFQLGSR